MKLLHLLLLGGILFSCVEEKKKIEERESDQIEREVLVPEFQSIIDSAGVKGAILIYDFQKKVHYSNNFQWARKGNLPASTFKITNSIIALEVGVVDSDTTLFRWNGQQRALKNWEQDLKLKDAFHFSCVPCYQEVARKIGVDRMVSYLTQFNYGTMVVDSSNLDIFWLEGNSQISQYQQIDFLTRFYQSKLPISQTTEKIMKQLMVIKENDHYKLAGKTGWSIRNGRNNGWFVGYVEAHDKVYFFATNIEPMAQFNMKMFPMIRKELTDKALKQLNILH